MKFSIVCIVEGHGEVPSLPILLRRILANLTPSFPYTIECLRVPRDQIANNGDKFQKTIELAARKVNGFGGILVLFDADDDCPRNLGPQVLENAKNVRNDIPIRTVVANREFESWFIAAARSLAGQRGLPENLEPPAILDDIRDAKGWLGSRMGEAKAYSPSVDQPAFTVLFDLEQARENSDSFDKFSRDIETLISQAQETFQDAIEEESEA